MADRIDDAADDMPSDPTSTVTEITYQPTATINRQRTTSLTNVPTLLKPEADEKKKDQRTTFSGIITDLGDVKEVPRKYKVLRQDLKLGFAFCHGNERGYNDFRIGEEVSLIATEVQGIWAIVGGPRKKILPTMTLRAVAQGPGEEIDIKYNTIVQQTDFDTFSLDEDGAITVNCDEDFEVQLNLDFQAVVTLTNPQKTTINAITDIRMGEFNLEVEITEIHAIPTTREPFWAIKIPLTTCPSY